MAAHRLGLTNFNCIILEPNDMDVKLGLEVTAERWGLHTLDDVKIIEGSKHPFMEITTMLLPQEIAGNINNVLMERMEENPGPGIPSPMGPTPRVDRPSASKGAKKAGAKKSSAKKAPAKKAESKKTPAKKEPAKKEPAKKPAAKKPAAKKSAAPKSKA